MVCAQAWGRNAELVISLFDEGSVTSMNLETCTHLLHVCNHFHMYTYSPSHTRKQSFFAERTHTHTRAQWAAICSHQSSCLGSPSGPGHHQCLSLSFCLPHMLSQAHTNEADTNRREVMISGTKLINSLGRCTAEKRRHCPGQRLRI